jgi:hypothetical protein
LLDSCETAEVRWREEVGIVGGIGRDDHLQLGWYDREALLGFEDYRHCAGVRLQTDGRDCNDGGLRRVAEFEHHRHSCGTRRFASHSQPVEEPAPHFVAGLIQALGDFGAEARRDVQYSLPEVSLGIGKVPVGDPRARPLTQFSQEVGGSACFDLGRCGDLHGCPPSLK